MTILVALVGLQVLLVGWWAMLDYFTSLASEPNRYIVCSRKGNKGQMPAMGKGGVR